MNDHVWGFEKFRQAIKSTRERYPQHWETSRKLMGPANFQTTVPVLLQYLHQCPLDPSLRDRVIDAVQQFSVSAESREGNRLLKELTGLSPSKAVRALFVWGVLAVGEESGQASVITADRCTEIIQGCSNPYEVLQQTTSPSLLDIGAGDLSFEQELVDDYVRCVGTQKTPLTLHAFDRLMPGSKVGGVYHKNVDRERYLQNFPSEVLRFRFWGGMGLDTFSKVKGRLPRYTVATCHAPANPTFAYEPSRLSKETIQAHLQSSRGRSRRGRFEGEPVLEVSHGGRTLTFPEWKFEIVGPLALLRFMTRQSGVSILSAIDDDVFWESLGQLMADDRYRPRNTIFSKALLPEVFGTVYEKLSAMAEGERIDLSRLADLRSSLNGHVDRHDETQKSCRLRYVEIRRGAVWEGVPSSFTARQFAQMKEESTPWWIILVTDGMEQGSAQFPSGKAH